MNRVSLSSIVASCLMTSLLTWPAFAASSKNEANTVGTMDCVINPSVVADLGSGVPGILHRIGVDRSDFVKAGDVIAELESGVESAALDLARARAELTTEVDLREVNAAFGQRQNKRTRDLFQRKAISTNDMDQRQTEARLAQIQLRQARDNQDLAQLEMLRAEEILRRRTIKSPIAGVVMERFKVVGEYVEDQPVVRVAQIDPLHVEVIVPIDHLGMVRDGMSAEVWSDAVEGQKWRATVDRVDQVADVASGTYGVRLVLPNPGNVIPAGLRCRMQLVEGSGEPATVQQNNANAVGMAHRQAAAIDTKEAAVKPVVVAEKHTKPPVVATQPAEAPVVAKKPVKLLPVGFKAIERRVVSKPTADKDESHLAEINAAATAPEAVKQAVAPVPAVATVVEKTAAPKPPVAAAVAEKVSDPKPPVDVVSGSISETPIEPIDALPECRLVGPYDDEVKATKKVVALRRAGLYVDIKSVPSSIAAGYMIATPVLPNRAEAEKLVAKLEAAGITDLYLPKRSRKPLRISLGLYKGKKMAQRQIAKFEKKGFEAELLRWKQKGSQHFLVVRGAPSEQTDKLLAGLPVPDDTSDTTEGFCNQFAVR